MPEMRIIFTKSDLLSYLTLMNVNSELKNDIVDGISSNSMSLRVTEHIINKIDWNNLISDPIRKQFLPMRSEYLPDHPSLKMDSLAESKSQINPGLIHRYPNKILFLITTFCPAYCSFCTRSYLVGPSTQTLKKSKNLNKSFSDSFKYLINYLNSNANINDVVISGGDVTMVKPLIIKELFDRLIKIESLKTIRLATRTLLFDPNQLLPSTSLFEVIAMYSDKFRQCNKELSIQCHFNHANEFSDLSKKASLALWHSGVVIRNQTVLLDGINSSVDTQRNLIEKLIESGIQPYYVYQMDMVANVEHFRTSLSTSINISKALTGLFPGFQLPRFIVDLPSGGGKRSVYEYEFYDKKYGVSGFKSPLLSGEKLYYYCDPLRYLDPDVEQKWNNQLFNFKEVHNENQ